MLRLLPLLLLPALGSGCLLTPKLGSIGERSEYLTTVNDAWRVDGEVYVAYEAMVWNPETGDHAKARSAPRWVKVEVDPDTARSRKPVKPRAGETKKGLPPATARQGTALRINDTLRSGAQIPDETNFSDVGVYDVGAGQAGRALMVQQYYPKTGQYAYTVYEGQRDFRESWGAPLGIVLLPVALVIDVVTFPLYAGALLAPE